MSKVKVNTIYSESDYRRFKFLDGNRDANGIMTRISRIRTRGFGEIGKSTTFLRT